MPPPQTEAREAREPPEPLRDLRITRFIDNDEDARTPARRTVRFVDQAQGEAKAPVRVDPLTGESHEEKRARLKEELTLQLLDTRAETNEPIYAALSRPNTPVSPAPTTTTTFADIHQRAEAGFGEPGYTPKNNKSADDNQRRS